MSAPRLWLLIAVGLVFSLGLVMIFNTSSAEVLDHALDQDTHRALLRQIIYAVLGSFVAAGAWQLGYENILKLSFPLLCVVTLLLALTFVPGIGVQANGARRWIGVAGYTLQPSELAKYLIPIYFMQVCLEQSVQRMPLKVFIRALAFLAVPILLILAEPDNGSVAIIGMTMMVVFFLTRIRFRYWALPMLALLLVGGSVASQLPYVRGRLKVYLNPELDIRGKGHQPHQAKIASGAGGLWGRGPGRSIQKFSYLPEAQNDYIAAIFAEEFGFMGVMTLLLLYISIAYFGFHIALRAVDLGGFYIASICTFLICIQAFLNLAVVSGLLPSTGLNLPFFSQGGSSLMANIVAIGIVLNVAFRSERTCPAT